MDAKANITDEEIAMLEAVESADDWDETVDKIKKARGNTYPADWWPKVKLSGLMDRVLAKFGETSDIKIAPLELDSLKFGKVQEIK